MKTAINNYRINKYILTGDYVCSDPQNKIFLLCKDDQINNNIFHKNLFLPGIVFPIEIVILQHQKYRSFPLNNQNTHLLVKLQSFQFSQFQIIKKIKKLFQVMKSAIGVKDIQNELLPVLNLDNVWLQNNQLKIIWHPRSGKQTYEDTKFLSKIGIISYYLLTGKNYTNLRDLEIIRNRVIFSLIYNLICNKEEGLKIQYAQQFFQQILSLKSKKRRISQYDYRSDGQRKIGSIKLQYLNKYKQDNNMAKTLVTPFRTQRQSVFHTPLYRYFQSAKKQQEAAQNQEKLRKRDFDFIKNQLDNVKKQLQKVRRAQTVQPIKQNEQIKKAKKQIRIGAPISVADKNIINDKLKQELNKTIDKSIVNDLKQLNNKSIDKSIIQDQLKQELNNKTIDKPIIDDQLKQDLNNKSINITIDKTVEKPIINDNDKLKQELNKTIDFPPKQNKQFFNNTSYNFNRQFTIKNESRNSYRYSSPTKAEPGNLWAILRHRELRKLNSSKKQQKSFIQQTEQKPPSNINIPAIISQVNAQVKQQKIQIQKKQSKTQVQNKQQKIQIQKKQSIIQKKQISEQRKNQNKSNIIQIKQIPKIIQDKPQMTKVIEPKQVNAKPNHNQDINSNQSIKSFPVNIENITNSKKLYINFINLLGESVSRSYRVIKNIQIENLDKIVGSYFIYKRFYYQRKKIQQSLEFGKKDIMYRVDQKPIKKSVYQQWKKTEEFNTFYATFKKQNLSIQQTAKKILERVLKKEQVPDHIKNCALLQNYDMQKQQMIIYEYIKNEYDLLIKYDKINDDIRIHLSQVIDSLSIVLQLNKKNPKYMVNVDKRKRIKQYAVSYLMIQQQFLTQLRKQRNKMINDSK